MVTHRLQHTISRITYHLFNYMCLNMFHTKININASKYDIIVQTIKVGRSIYVEIVKHQSSDNKKNNYN